MSFVTPASFSSLCSRYDHHFKLGVNHSFAGPLLSQFFISFGCAWKRAGEFPSGLQFPPPTWQAVDQVERGPGGVGGREAIPRLSPVPDLLPDPPLAESTHWGDTSWLA